MLEDRSPAVFPSLERPSPLYPFLHPMKPPLNRIVCRRKHPHGALQQRPVTPLFKVQQAFRIPILTSRQMA